MRTEQMERDEDMAEIATGDHFRISKGEFV